MARTQSIVPRERIESSILLIRGHRVMLDADLATLYGTTTKALNQAVRRNAGRFPSDFMFPLTPREKQKVVTYCDHLRKLKYSPALPRAFTEQGVAMLSSVLRSRRAVQVNVEIMRAFVRLRHVLSTHKDLARKLAELERKYQAHDNQFKVVFDAIRELMAPKRAAKQIGFRITT